MKTIAWRRSLAVWLGMGFGVGSWFEDCDGDLRRLVGVLLGGRLPVGIGLLKHVCIVCCL